MSFRKTVLDDGSTCYEMDSVIERDGRTQIWRISRDGESYSLNFSDPALLDLVPESLRSFPTRPEAMKYIAELDAMHQLKDMGEPVRRGKFSLSSQFLMTFPHNMVFISNVQIETFKPISSSLITRPGNGKQPAQPEAIFECIGISEYFEEIEDGTDPPVYKIKFAEDGGKRIGMVVEKEG